MDKLISIIMSTYNESKVELNKAIESILNQSYTNYEFIIILDNPKNDMIKKILNEYSKKDDRIKLHFNDENIGLANSLNLAIKMSSGEYIARMDADDIAFEDRLEKEINFLESNNLDMVSTNRIDIDENDLIISKKSNLPKLEKINRLLPLGNFITHPTVLIKRSVIESLNGYRNFPSSQDYDLWLRVLSKNYKIGILDEELLFYRIRTNSISNKDKYKQYLIKQYQKQLYFDRKKYGYDKFSEENLKLFLENSSYSKKKDAFNYGITVLDKGIRNLNNKKYITGIVYVLKSFTTSKAVMDEFFSTLKYKILCKI
ncbi:glycosyltransferase [Clostridium perfringens]|uniref:glycosyltransferase n=1 Tax=Clostridium perfringens TaxID=1502 RepID=UPI0018E41160|nr:glycosyltransferase [Clostridium perfringens]MBI6077503.1 glycosyltransferase [Clostridium perfringens]